jgi:putative flavoprotein involved in K+ transport
MPLHGDPNGYPSKDEVADYLSGYAARFEIPLKCNTRVIALRRCDAGFELETENAQVLQADAVIVATGPFQRSVLPRFSHSLSREVHQASAQSYRGPYQLPRGERVLVVGGGATGRQIAHELAADREVWLSLGRNARVTPRRIAGRDILWWFDRIGALRADKDSVLGRLVRANEAFPGLELTNTALRRRGVKLMARTSGADSGRIRFSDGGAACFAAVVWAIGYADETAWIHVPGALDAAGNFAQERGVSPVPGLFFVGRSWQSCRASALLCGVGEDAATTVTSTKRFVAKNAGRDPALWSASTR